MAHFAEVGDNNIVTRVLVVHNNELMIGDEENENKGIDFLEMLYNHRNWVQCSYNGNMRYNFPGIGFHWDPDNNAFYAPQPYPSWSLNEQFRWQAPVPYPEVEEGSKNRYSWNEENQSWDLITE